MNNMNKITNLGIHINYKPIILMGALFINVGQFNYCNISAMKKKNYNKNNIINNYIINVTTNRLDKIAWAMVCTGLFGVLSVPIVFYTSYTLRNKY